MKNNSLTLKITISAISAALCAVATLIMFPLPFGYINLGDLMIYACVFALADMPYWFFAPALGAGIIDMFGYIQYAPVTVVFKGLTVFLMKKVAGSKSKAWIKAVMFFVLALISPLAYFAFESVIYGVSAAVAGVLYNVLQSEIGLGAGVLLGKLVKKALDRLG